MENSDTILRLSANDNIVVCRKTMEAGDAIQIEGSWFTIDKTIGVGHKMAARDIEAGEKIYKLNVVIGTATLNIKAGEHVHLHNMKSDFIPTYTIQNKNE